VKPFYQVNRRVFLKTAVGAVTATLGVSGRLVDSAGVWAQEGNLSGVARLAVGFQFADGKGPVRLPVEVYRNLMIVEGRILGSRPLRFILDSGAAGSIIDKAVASEIGLKPTDKTAISGVTGTAEGGRIGVRW